MVVNYGQLCKSFRVGFSLYDLLQVHRSDTKNELSESGTRKSNRNNDDNKKKKKSPFALRAGLTYLFARRVWPSCTCTLSRCVESAGAVCTKGPDDLDGRPDSSR